MRADLEHELISKYPKIFKNVFLTVQESPMAWGIECGDGWFELIDKLCSDLGKLDADVVADQVKEKFGGLRFYIHTASTQDTAWDLIQEAEDKSYHICELCGKSGGLSSNGYWLKTLCEDHRKEHGYLIGDNPKLWR